MRYDKLIIFDFLVYIFFPVFKCFESVSLFSVYA